MATTDEMATNRIPRPSAGLLDDLAALGTASPARLPLNFGVAAHRETAENLTQDCVIRAYQTRSQFRGAAKTSTWLMQIAPHPHL
jgi:DNA-directed RNA polymerase specialized sigma24 family protein